MTLMVISPRPIARVLGNRIFGSAADLAATLHSNTEVIATTPSKDIQVRIAKGKRDWTCEGLALPSSDGSAFYSYLSAHAERILHA